MVESKQEIN
jgi:cyclophilin family peptidyl-prolyl cis-trans isomerase